MVDPFAIQDRRMILISFWRIVSQTKATAGIIVHWRTVVRNMIFAILALPAVTTICVAETGELVLRAVDIDTGKPITGVSFAIENGYEEDSAVKDMPGSMGKGVTFGSIPISKEKPRRSYWIRRNESSSAAGALLPRCGTSSSTSRRRCPRTTATVSCILRGCQHGLLSRLQGLDSFVS